jgi:hypothetical protein
LGFCKNHPGFFVRLGQTKNVSRRFLKYELLQWSHYL